MFKWIRDNIEAFEWLKNRVKTRSRKYVVGVFVVIVLVGLAILKFYAGSYPKSTKPPDTSAVEESDRKNIKNELKKFYGELGVLSDYPISTGDINALQVYENRVNQWVSDTSMWIEINIGFGAREKFLNRGKGGHVESSNYEERLNKLLSDLRGYKLGLEELIKSDKMWFENKE